MFCPKCATQNVDGASFCRSCGANVSLIPQALAGQLLQPDEDDDIAIGRRGRRRYGRKLSLDQAIKKFFMGVAFLFVSIALSFSIGKGWWFWLLIPAFSMMGTGIAQYIRIKEQEKRAFPMVNVGQPLIQPTARVGSFPTRSTSELVDPPPSVTEGTTRHLGTEAPTRHLDASNELQK